MTGARGLSSISRRLWTADLIAWFSERRIKDSAFEHTTIGGIGDRAIGRWYRGVVITMSESLKRQREKLTFSKLIEPTSRELCLPPFLPPSLSSLSTLVTPFILVAAFTKEPARVNSRATVRLNRINRIIILIPTRHHLITHLRSANIS